MIERTNENLDSIHSFPTTEPLPMMKCIPIESIGMRIPVQIDTSSRAIDTSGVNRGILESAIVSGIS